MFVFLRFVDFDSYDQLEASGALAALEHGCSSPGSDVSSELKVPDDCEESDRLVVMDVPELGTAAHDTVQKGVVNETPVYFTFWSCVLS